MNISIADGATCNYVRIKHVIGGVDRSEHIRDPIDAEFSADIPIPSGPSAQDYKEALLKVEGEHGRVSRHNGATSIVCADDIEDECEFWNADCEEIDCIYEGKHFRYQCAMAEVGEEPKANTFIGKCGLMFRRSAT